MLKKIVLGTLLVGLIGILVAGAIIRTVDKTAQVAEARGLDAGQSYGRGAGQGVGVEHEGATQGRGGYGQGNAAAGSAERQYVNNEGAPDEWVVYEGVVVQTPSSGVDLVIQTNDGEEIVVGAGPGYMETQGFALQAGEQVQVQGYWEDGELKAAQVTCLDDGQTITLRDEVGHPAWAGSGNRAVEQQAAADPSSPGQGQGRGRGGSYGAQGRGQGGLGGGEHEIAPGGGDVSESEVEALQMALTDEYKAWSVYDQVIADLGAVRPFTSIQKAEENHIAALVNLFDRYGLDAPQNEWPGNIPAFETLGEACAVGVQAEIDNAALYDQLFSMVDNPDIVRVFTALQRASLAQHLPAFERCAP